VAGSRESPFLSFWVQW